MYVLLVDDDTYVNVRLLKPGGPIHQFIHTVLKRSNIAIGEFINDDKLSINKITKYGFLGGGAGYLLGRATLKKLVSNNLLNVSLLNNNIKSKVRNTTFDDLNHVKSGELTVIPNEFLLTSEQRAELSLFNDIVKLSEKHCSSTCLQVISNSKYKNNINRSNSMDRHDDSNVNKVTLAIRVIDMCVSLMSNENTCYHSDHAISRCLFHAIYADSIDVGCTISKQSVKAIYNQTASNSKIVESDINKQYSQVNGVRQFNLSFGMCMEDNQFCNIRHHLTCHRYMPRPKDVYPIHIPKLPKHHNNNNRDNKIDGIENLPLVSHLDYVAVTDDEREDKSIDHRIMNFYRMYIRLTVNQLIGVVIFLTFITFRILICC
jgi:hypothetical protein